MTPELTALTLAALLQVAQYGSMPFPPISSSGPAYTTCPATAIRRNRCPTARPACGRALTTISRG